jgi:serine/threonine protein kinase/Flp pilus assembly protein TadD
MTSEQLDEKAIFNVARSIPSGEARAEYLRQACGRDATLLNRIEALLRGYEEQASFLDSPVISPPLHGEGFLDVTKDQPSIAEQPGTTIGPYKLLQQIGEGGMGVVFMAEQDRPVQRTVALKIIKPGMDTRQVIARFEAERQAVAMMDHPNIAKVLDAGKTDSGRPYFVMELVKGVPITRYCDDKHLPLRARLELFVQVCQAVQHAHQKGIIHRDIKPNNVLVAEYDNRAVPKVIDFGVAKATAQRLTERTMFTEFGQVLGTMEYMSPEQSKFNQLDIDTRSDIYSLGVLLYELLAGSTPFEGKRLKEAAFDEMLRIIREEEPPKPSTRLSSLKTTSDSLPLAGRDQTSTGDPKSPERSAVAGREASGEGVRSSLASIAANRQIEPARLSKDVRGELDWIVMKALEKDRNRRYETASGLAADIERHLHDEPVEAGPPSAAYRFRKFARRNRTGLATAALILFFLVLLGGGVGWAARDRAAREQQLAQDQSARQSRVSGQLELILDEAAKLEQAEKWSDALVSARRAEPALASGEAVPEIQARARQALADLKLIQQLEDIRGQSGTVWTTAGQAHLAARADQEYAATFRQAGIDVDALPVSEAVDRITARRTIAAALLPALDDWLAVRSMDKDEPLTRRLIDVLHAADPDPWRQRVREAMARKDQSALAKLVTAADLDRQPAATLTLLYSALWASEKPREQELVLRSAQWKYPGDYWINLRLGVDLIWRHAPNDIRDGIGYTRAAAALRPQNAHPVMILGVGYNYLGRNDQAIACFRKAIELNPNDWASYTNLGIALGEKGLHEEAIAAFEQAIKLSPQDESLVNDNRAWLLANSADAKRRDPDKAVKIAKRVVELFPNNGAYWNTLGTAQYRAGDWHEAIDALKKSEKLPPDRSSNCLNALFLAMAHWQLGEQDEARRWYGKAVDWMEKQQTDDKLLRRFRAEAEELLKITDEKPTTKPQVDMK